MDLRASIEHLRASWIDGYAKSEHMKPGRLGFRQVCFNTIVDELNRLEALSLEFEAMHHVAIGRAVDAEADRNMLCDWLLLHGIDPREPLSYGNDDRFRRIIHAATRRVAERMPDWFEQDERARTVRFLIADEALKVSGAAASPRREEVAEALAGGTWPALDRYLHRQCNPSTTDLT